MTNCQMSNGFKLFTVYTEEIQAKGTNCLLLSIINAGCCSIEFSYFKESSRILQEIEIGKVDQDQLHLVRRIKNQYTQRLIQSQKVGINVSVQACSHFRKGFCRLDNNHIVHGDFYQNDCSFCLKETGKKFDLTLIKYILVIKSKHQQNELDLRPSVKQPGNTDGEKIQLYDGLQCLYTSNCNIRY